MTTNEYVKCKYRGTIIRLRTQIGYFNCPIFFCCPDCGTEIYGTVIIGQETPSIKYELKNAELTKDHESTKYVSEQSVEFPQRKIYPETNTPSLTPFIRAMELYGDMDNSEIKRVFSFIQIRDSEWNQIKACIRLYDNFKLDLVIKQLKNRFPEQNTINTLDALMLLHHWFIPCVTKALPKKTTTDFIEFANKIVSLFSNESDAIQNYLEYLRSNDVLAKGAERIASLIDDFFNMAEKLMPVIITINSGTYDQINREELGLSTVGFNELKTFYANSYEELLRLLDIVIALNNIKDRGGYDILQTNSVFRTYEEVVRSTKRIKKLELLTDTDTFSKPLNLNNRIRNAINHYSTKKDDNAQKIYFIDEIGRAHV